MCSMRSMHGGLFPVVEGPCKLAKLKVCHGPARQLPSGAADGLFPGGRPREQNEWLHSPSGGRRLHTVTVTVTVTGNLLLL
jgi:hypothetical protein